MAPPGPFVLAGERLADRRLEVQVAQPNRALSGRQIGQAGRAAAGEQHQVAPHLVLLLLSNHLLLADLALQREGQQRQRSTEQADQDHGGHEGHERRLAAQDEEHREHRQYHRRVDGQEQRVARLVLGLAVGTAAARVLLLDFDHLVEPDGRLGAVPDVPEWRHARPPKDRVVQVPLADEQQCPNAHQGSRLEQQPDRSADDAHAQPEQTPERQGEQREERTATQVTLIDGPAGPELAVQVAEPAHPPRWLRGEHLLGNLDVDPVTLGRPRDVREAVVQAEHRVMFTHLTQLLLQTLDLSFHRLDLRLVVAAPVEVDLVLDVLDLHADGSLPGNEAPEQPHGVAAEVVLLHDHALGRAALRLPHDGGVDGNRARPTHLQVRHAGLQRNHDPVELGLALLNDEQHVRVLGALFGQLVDHLFGDLPAHRNVGRHLSVRILLDDQLDRCGQVFGGLRAHVHAPHFLC